MSGVETIALTGLGVFVLIMAALVYVMTHEDHKDD